MSERRAEENKIKVRKRTSGSAMTTGEKRAAARRDVGVGIGAIDGEYDKVDATSANMAAGERWKVEGRLSAKSSPLRTSAAQVGIMALR